MREYEHRHIGNPTGDSISRGEELTLSSKPKRTLLGKLHDTLSFIFVASICCAGMLNVLSYLINDSYHCKVSNARRERYADGSSFDSIYIEGIGRRAIVYKNGEPRLAKYDVTLEIEEPERVVFYDPATSESLEVRARVE